jgi:hypothetical protein
MPNGYLCKNIPVIRLTYGICILIVKKKKKKKRDKDQIEGTES